MSEHAIPDDLQVWYGVACDGIEFKTSHAAIKVLIERIAKAEAERDALKSQTPASEVIKRLEGAYVVAGLELPVPPDWQVMIDRFRASAQAQAHLAKLASERYDQLLEKDRENARPPRRPRPDAGRT